jgi:lysophospholipase L1-like esterase
MMILGDSIAAGYPTTSGFRGKIARALEGRPITFVGPFEDDDGLVHAGFHGHTLASILTFLPELLSYRPDMLLISAAGNGLPDTPAETIGDQMATLCLAFIRNGAKVIYVSLVPDVRNYSPIIAAYNAAIRRAVEQIPQVHLIDMGSTIGLASKDSPYFSDDAHANKLGYERMADHFLLRAFHIQAPKDDAGATVGGAAVIIPKAKAALDEAYPYLNPQVAFWALAVGLLSRYGLQSPWVYGNDDGSLGEPSHNWGMLKYADWQHSGLFYTHPGGEAYAKFPTAEEGVICFIESWANKDVQKAIMTNDPYTIAAAMRRDPLYGQALEQSAIEVHRALPDAFHLSSASVGAEQEPTGKPFSPWNVGVLIAAVGLFGATLLINRRKTAR